MNRKKTLDGNRFNQPATIFGNRNDDEQQQLLQQQNSSMPTRTAAAAAAAALCIYEHMSGVYVVQLYNAEHIRYSRYSVVNCDGL